MDGKVKGDHFNFESNDKRLNFINIDKEGDGYSYLIKNFSPPESVILDVTQSKGMSFHNQLYANNISVCIFGIRYSCSTSDTHSAECNLHCVARGV